MALLPRFFRLSLSWVKFSSNSASFQEVGQTAQEQRKFATTFVRLSFIFVLDTSVKKDVRAASSNLAGSIPKLVACRCGLPP
jgi:hypothetical protein